MPFSLKQTASGWSFYSEVFSFSFIAFSFHKLTMKLIFCNKNTTFLLYFSKERKNNRMGDTDIIFKYKKRENYASII